MAIAYNTSTVRNGLVLYLDAANPKSYPGSGTTWSDLSGNGYGGSLVGATSFSSSPSKFDTNATTINEQNHLSTSSQITLTDGSSYTWDFYIRLRSSAQAIYHSLVGRGATTSWLSVFPYDTTGNSWNIRYRQNNGTYSNSSNITDWNIQNWTNITITVDSSRNLNIYINGVFRETLLPTSTLFYISRICGGYISSTTYYSLQGSLGAFKMYNRALSASEVQQNFNALRGRYGI